MEALTDRLEALIRAQSDAIKEQERKASGRMEGLDAKLDALIDKQGADKHALIGLSSKLDELSALVSTFGECHHHPPTPDRCDCGKFSVHAHSPSEYDADI